jgi:hypothetical protein
VGATYKISAAADLAGAPWIDFDLSLQATGSSLTWTDLTTQAVSQRYYQVFEIR